MNAKEVKTYSQGLTEYEFKRIEEESVYPENKYVLVCGDIRLYLMDERKFVLYLDMGESQGVFELVGEKDFSEFFAEGEGK